MKSSCIYTCILLCLYVCNSHGQTLDDNIVITQCSDSYIFMEEDGIPTVRNRKETSYEATRMGTALQPYTYYGEFISLDGASAKGGGKAEYKRFASSTSISTVKEKRQKLRLSVLFMTCIILHESIWVRTIL